MVLELQLSFKRHLGSILSKVKKAIINLLTLTHLSPVLPIDLL